MNRLSTEKRAQLLALLAEGTSMRATARIADVSYNTVLKFLPEIGGACWEYQDRHLRGLTSKRIQVDEIWSFCYAKNKNVPIEYRGMPGFGDVWTWTAIDPDTKLVPSWLVGGRGAEYARIFMADLATRLNTKVQLTSDGHRAYLEAVEDTFGVDVDYAQLVKLYGEEASPDSSLGYSPYVGAERTPLIGRPDKRHISTSICERQNLTMRMSISRFGRRTNAHSKKLANHAHSVAIHFMYYNFARIHSTLRVTPAMAAGVTDTVWSLQDIVELAA